MEKNNHFYGYQSCYFKTKEKLKVLNKLLSRKEEMFPQKTAGELITMWTGPSLGTKTTWSRVVKDPGFTTKASTMFYGLYLTLSYTDCVIVKVANHGPFLDSDTKAT